MAKMISINPVIIVLDDFLTHDECNYLIDVASSSSLLRKSFIYFNETSVSSSYARQSTSFSIPIHWRTLGMLNRIEYKIAASCTESLLNGEELQIQHYGTGDFYSLHYDYFDSSRLPQRKLTVLLYLNTVSRGGETVFPFAQNKKEMNLKMDQWYRNSYESFVEDESAHFSDWISNPDLLQKVCDDPASLKIQPKRGRAVLFYSLNQQNVPDIDTLHGSCAVVEGEKWIAQKWFRDDMDVIQHVKNLSDNLEVKVGDIIYLSTESKREDDRANTSFVHAEGLNDCRIGLLWNHPNGTEPVNFSECLFRICPQLSYESKKNLKKLVRKKNPTAHQMAHEEEKVQKEEKRNEELINETGLGSGIGYGQVMQLQHVKSGKFLSLQSRTLADQDKECMMLRLIEKGDEESWFRFEPRFKIREAGGQIFMNDQATLQSAKMSDQYLHVSELLYTYDRRGYDGGQRKEVNLFTIPTGFKIGIHSQQGSDRLPYLRAGQPVRLFHPEADSFVNASSSLNIQKPPYLYRKSTNNFEHVSNRRAKTIFIVERHCQMEGGHIKWMQTCRFRHVATGKYLAMTHDDSESRNAGAVSSQAICRNIQLCDGDSPLTHFRLHPVTPPDDPEMRISINSPISAWLQHDTDGNPTRFWLHNTQIPKKDLASSGDFDIASGKVNFRLAFSSAQLGQDAISVQLVGDQELRDAYHVESSKAIIETFIGLVMKSSPLNPLKRPQTIDIVRCLSDMIFFLSNTADNDPLTCSGIPIVARQQIVRELKFIDMLFWITEAPLEAGYELRDLKDREHMMLRHVFKLAFKCLTHCAIEHLRNQQYLTNRSLDIWRGIDINDARPQYYLECLVMHCGYGNGAAGALKNLVTQNRKLLEENIDTQTIGMFLSLIRDLGPKERFMHFLNALCSCNGIPVPSNQGLLLGVLLLNSKSIFSKNRLEILVETTTTSDSATRKWTSKSDPDKIPKRFLGQNLLDKGRNAIAISWFSTENWTEKSPFLYYSPSYFNLKPSSAVNYPKNLRDYEDSLSPTIHDRQWVKLEQVAWTLNPETHFKYSGMAGDWDTFQQRGKDDPLVGLQFNQMMELAGYYVAQIELFASLCSSRAYNCIECLEEHFSFELLLTGINDDRLPSQLRGAFAKLIGVLYVDRFPHEVLLVPNLVRSYADICEFGLQNQTTLPQFKLPETRNLLNTTNEFVCHPDATKMFLLMDYIRSHFSSQSGKHQFITDSHGNIFTMHVLDVLQKALVFGFYTTFEDLCHFVTPLLKTLDGRRDLLSSSDLLVAATSQSPSLIKVPALDMKKKSMFKLMVPQRTSTAKIFPEEEEEEEVEDETEDQILATRRVQDVRCSITNDTRLVAKTKEKMCDVFIQLLDVQMDARISKFLSEYRKAVDSTARDSDNPYVVVYTGTFADENSLPKSPRSQPVDTCLTIDGQPGVTLSALGLQAIDKNFEDDDFLGLKRLSKTTDERVEAICLDLMMYDDDNLFSKGLQLLLKYKTQRQQFIQNLSELQLLDNPESVNAYETLKMELSTLLHHIESFETWRSEKTTSMSESKKIYENVIDILTRLRYICSSGGGHEDGPEPNRMNQDMLRNMGVHTIVLKILYLKTTASELKSKDGYLFEIKLLSNKFVARFLQGNPVNQHLLFEHIDLFVSQMGHGLGVAFAVAEMFRGNRKLCDKLPSEVLWKFANAIEKSGPQIRWIEFFRSVIAAEGALIKRNQELVLRVITDKQYSRVCELYTEGIDTATPSMDIPNTPGYQARLKRMIESSSCDTSSTEMSYHSSLVSLMALTCKGRMAAAEAKCQKMLPVDLVLQVILDKATLPAIRSAYSQFLTYVFFETDIIGFEYLSANARVWEVMEMYMSDVRSFMRMSDDSKDLEKVKEKIMSETLPAIESFFKHIYDADIAKLEFSENASKAKDCIELLMTHPLAKGAFKTLAISCGLEMGLYNRMVKKGFGDIVTPLLKAKGSLLSPRSVEAQCQKPMKVLTKAESYQRFCDGLLNCKEIQDRVHMEFIVMTTLLSDVELITSRPATDTAIKTRAITVEELFRRVIQYLNHRAQSDADVITAPLLKILRVYLQRFAPPTPNEIKAKQIGKVQVENQAVLYKEKQCDLDSFGASALAINFISNAHDDETIIEAMKLMCELLERNNQEVQVSVYKYLTEKKLFQFFRELSLRAKRTVEGIKRRRRELKYQKRMAIAGVYVNSAASISQHRLCFNDTADPIRIDLVFRVLHLLVEGHKNTLQNLLREQPATFGFRASFNLILEAVNLLGIYLKNDIRLEEIDESDAKTVDRLLGFIVDVSQGPCLENQAFLANSILVDICKRILSVDTFILIKSDTIKTLKARSIKALASLIEWREDLIVHRTLLDNLDITVLCKRIVQIYDEYDHLKESYRWDPMWDERFLDEGYELLRMLRNLVQSDTKHRFSAVLEPSFNPLPLNRDHYKSDKAFENARNQNEDNKKYFTAYYSLLKQLASVEVRWNGKLGCVHFPLPSECSYLTEDTKESVKSKLDYGSDDKHRDFIEMARDIVSEMQHYERLSAYALYQTLGVHLHHLKKLGFILAIILNFTLLVTLEHSGRSVNFRTEYSRQFISFLGASQCLTSSLILGFVLANRAPVVAKKLSRQMDIHQKNAFLFEITAAMGKSTGLLMKAFSTTLKTASKVVQGKQNLSGVMQAMEAGARGTVVQAFGKSITAALTTLIGGGILISVFPETRLSYFWELGLGLSLVFFGQGIRRYYLSPVSTWTYWYCCIYDTLTDPETLFFIAYLATALLGVFVGPYFFIFHLLDIVVMSSALQNVVQAMIIPRKALGMTALLGFITIYIFTTIAFYSFHDDISSVDRGQECKTMLLCFTSFVHNGLLSGGGMGDFMTYELGHFPLHSDPQMFVIRILFDLMFFICVLVLLLNIIFGITLDTFGSLREDSAKKEELMTTQCFICGISKPEFDTAAQKHGCSKGFSEHVEREHNMWHYLFFIAYLQHKDELDYTGVECFVARCIEQDDLSWIPNGQAMTLQEEADEQVDESEWDDTKKFLTEHIETTVAQVSKQMSHMFSKLEAKLSLLEARLLTEKQDQDET